MPGSHIDRPQQNSDEDVDMTLVNEVDEKGIAAMAHEPKPVEEEQERWNESKLMIIRYLQTLAAFIIMGMNDASVGVSSTPTIIEPH